jgi:hypothetical protein
MRTHACRHIHKGTFFHVYTHQAGSTHLFEHNVVAALYRAHEQLQQLEPRLPVWQRNVYAFLQSPSERLVQVPRLVARRKHHDQSASASPAAAQRNGEDWHGPHILADTDSASAARGACSWATRELVQWNAAMLEEHVLTARHLRMR